MFCTKCGAENEDSGNYCKKCGSLLSKEHLQNSQQLNYQQPLNNNNQFNNQNSNQLQTAAKSNTKKVLIIIGVIVVILVVVFFLIFSNLNKEKTPMSASTFSSTMETKGYTLTEATSQFSQYGNYVTKVYVAQKTNYQIEFYEISTEENAISMYNYNKSKFEAQKTGTYTSTNVDLKNYSIFSLTVNGKYKYISRIDNTIIYVDADEVYKNDIKNTIKELGY